MIPFALLRRGRLTARLAMGPDELAQALDLRGLCFRRARGLPPAPDVDRFDAVSDHMLIRQGDALLATFRLRTFADRADLISGYAAQYYDLARLPAAPGLELGRFCLHPEATDPDILRLAFAALTRRVDQTGAAMLIGCTSFAGTDMAPYQTALAPHLAALRADPPAIAAERVALRDPGPTSVSQLPLPPLLRHYLSLGGLVSDHAVVDRALMTCHVLTTLAIAAIPPARARALRALAQD